MNTESFFSNYYGRFSQGYITVNHKTDNGLPGKWFDLSDANASIQMTRYVDQHKDHADVYFSTCVAAAPKEISRMAAADVSCVFMFFIDIDTQEDPEKVGKNVPETVDDAIRELSALEMPPSFIVLSGYGAHAYWTLRKPIMIGPMQEDTESVKRRMRAFSDGVAETLGYSDLNVEASEPARILRVPGTINHKRNGKAPVELYTVGDWKEYDVEVLEATYANRERLTPHTVAATPMGENNAEEVRTDDECIELILRMPTVSRLWTGDIALCNDDHSRADQTTCNALAEVTDSNPLQMDRLFRKSQLMREKWDIVHSAEGLTYGEMTIQKAIAYVRTKHSEHPYRKLKQFSLTNKLVYAIPRDEDVQSNGAAVMEIDEITVTVHSYLDIRVNNEKATQASVRKPLSVTTYRLLDAVMVWHTENYDHPQTVTLSFREYADLCGVKDVRFVREQMQVDAEYLLNMEIDAPRQTIYPSKKEEKRISFNLFEDIKSIRGGYVFTFGEEFYQMLCEHKSSFMYCPETLWRINLSKNPLSYFLLRKLAVNKRINLTKEREKKADTLSIKALTRALPLFPTYDDVQKSGRNTSRRMIRPFERDMNALSAAFSWRYCHEKGMELENDELPIRTYAQFQQLFVNIQWHGYPVKKPIVRRYPHKRRQKPRKTTTEE